MTAAVQEALFDLPSSEPPRPATTVPAPPRKRRTRRILTDLPIPAPRKGWILKAQCNDLAPEVWTPNLSDGERPNAQQCAEVEAHCRACPAEAHCARSALIDGDAVGFRAGVWCGNEPSHKFDQTTRREMIRKTGKFIAPLDELIYRLTLLGKVSSAERVDFLSGGWFAKVTITEDTASKLRQIGRTELMALNFDEAPVGEFLVHEDEDLFVTVYHDDLDGAITAITRDETSIDKPAT